MLIIEDPATGEELVQLPEMGLAETKQAIDAASRAFPSWSKTTAKARPTLHIQRVVATNVI
jgi:succinate-semialdehyde dehydrogenase / glutarate-semialdehyde dehydrogenase